jgi:hypothetical protein
LPLYFQQPVKSKEMRSIQLCACQVCLTHHSLLNAACVTLKTLLDLLHVSMIWYVLPTGENLNVALLLS